MASEGDMVAYYVTLRRGDRTAFLAGPFNRHGDALRRVQPAHDLAVEADSWAAFDLVGTARVRREPLPEGLFNAALGVGGRTGRAGVEPSDV